MILKCNNGCEHKYQDEKYGKGMRVHNRAKTSDPKVPRWRCTVCGNVRYS